MATATKSKATENGAVNRITDLPAPESMRPELMTFRVVGTSPLLQNNPASFIGKSEDASLTTKKVYKDEEEAELRTYRDVDGHFCHPSESFIKSMIRAVTGKKFGKVSAPGMLRQGVFVVEQYCILEDEHQKPLSQKYEIDRRSVVIGKARILRCRPMWSVWSTRVTFEVDAAIISADLIRQALGLAGRTVGIGDYRPEKGGRFGRFVCE